MERYTKIITALPASLPKMASIAKKRLELLVKNREVVDARLKKRWGELWKT